MENLTNIYTNIPSRGLITDLDSALVSKELWTYARNANHNTHLGNMNLLTNEPSNKFCCDLPYTTIGYVKLIGGRWAIFSTDNSSSEIGIFDSNNCSYTKLVNDRCLNFNTHYLIDGSSKENFDCSETVYWTDGFNPRRKLNLANIPYQFTVEDDVCQTKTFTNKLDCNALLVTPLVKIPTLTVSPGAGGTLENGSYQVAMAYTINKQRITNFHAVSAPVTIWSHINLGRSISIDITGLDREFNQFELVLIYTQKETTTAKIVGYYSTGTTHIEISSTTLPQYLPITMEDIETLRPFYYRADHVVNNDQFLLWAGVTTRPELNYQVQAMNIVPKWVLYQAPTGYYGSNGTKIGYSRGERYAFGIQWLFNTGEWSSVFHLPGRAFKDTDLNNATGADVYETTDGAKVKRKTFQVYDTSKVTRAIHDLTGDSAEGVVSEGNMSYWESTDIYPDNKIMFGDFACTPIRHPQFPEECNAPRYSKLGKAINILGVKFENIEHPKDASGNFISEIVGYRIMRSSREGNRSVIARGMFNNVRAYDEQISTDGTKETVLYANYPYNSLATDPFISSAQTSFQSNSERSYRGLSTYKTDQFNFYSPHTLFSHVALGEEARFETEEIGSTRGKFEYVFNHPSEKVLNNSVFWLAITIGAIDGVLSVFGKKCVTSLKEGLVSISQISDPPAEIIITAAGMKFVNDCETIANGLTFTEIFQLPAIEAAAKLALKVLQTAAKAGMAVYFAFNTASTVIKQIEAIMPFQKYATQYNSAATFTKNKCQLRDNLRRKINFYQYLSSSINTVQGVKFNNFKREESVYLKLNSGISEPTTDDTTLKTMRSASICSTPFDFFSTVASMYYGSVRRFLDNQYGQVDSIIYQHTGYTTQNLTSSSAVGSDDMVYKSDPVFGGDVYLNQIGFNKKHQFFSQNLSNSNSPDGEEYDYRLYRNVGYPRFWLDSHQYEISNLVAPGKFASKLPTNKYNLDCFKGAGTNTAPGFSNVHGFFYLFNNGVMNFICESEYNLDYRDYKGDMQNFYSKTQGSLSDIFRSDRIDKPEEFVYDKSLSKQLTETLSNQQRIDYNPALDQTCFSYYKNRVVYSLPASLDLKSDNWLVYLINNFYDFPLSDFGAITGMHAVDNQQILFTFDKAAPYITIGRDQLQTEAGIKVTIGDAGLFEREPRPLVYTDYYYGNSQSRWAFVNTQFGSFYPSQRQGRIFNWNGQFDEVSRNGMHWWFKNFLPSKLLEDFPNYFDADNPVIGEGLISGFDNTDEKYYLSKRDYKLKDIYKNFVTYDSNKKRFVFNGTEVKLTDPVYFDDASWTVSYSPKDKAFISWHDWQPDWIIQGENHFFTIKYGAMWLHNSRCDSYCNFYNIDYPFEIEYLINNGNNVEILRSIEYVMEVGKYFGDCNYLHTILDENFDSLVVYNQEQISGYRSPRIAPKNKVSQIADLPALNTDGDAWNIEFHKEENKYRINQFWDITKDRGEFSKFNLPLWTIQPNGYIKTITSSAVNYAKNTFQRKKLRNHYHKVYLSKSICGDKKFIFKLANSKNAVSPR